MAEEEGGDLEGEGVARRKVAEWVVDVVVDKEDLEEVVGEVEGGGMGVRMDGRGWGGEEGVVVSVGEGVDLMDEEEGAARLNQVRGGMGDEIWKVVEGGV